MNTIPSLQTSRRAFLKRAGQATAAATLAAGVVPPVHAAENNTIQLALVGCGGRGTGAAANALSVANGPTRLVAMADVFENRLAASYENVNKRFSDKVDVPEDRRFLGFDGYQKAMDCLKPGDIVILTTPPAFRWVHFAQAIEKGLNVFMEKPVTVDGPTTRKMIKLAEEATRKNLKVAVGLMWRHCAARRALHDQIQSGKLGDIVTLRAYRMHGPIASFASGPKPEGISELLYQIQRFHSFLWASGGAYSDFYIHNIDECCWMKGAWPVEAQSTGGRHYRGENIDQNFDSYSTEYTFADGTKLFLQGRCMVGCYSLFGSFAHGTKGAAVISSGMNCRTGIYQGQNLVKKDLVWGYPSEKKHDGPIKWNQPYQAEWNDLIDAIRRDKPYNEARRGAEASLVTSMGRMAAHTGRVVTYDEILNSDHEFAPGVDSLTMTSPAPLPSDDNGKYPVPMPGINTKREY